MNAKLFSLLIYVVFGIAFISTIKHAVNHSYNSEQTGNRKFKTNDIICIIIVYGIIVFMFTFREVSIGYGGNDTQIYLTIFHSTHISDVTLDKAIYQIMGGSTRYEVATGEPLFLLFNALLKSITNSGRVYLFMIHAFSMFSYIYFCLNMYEKGDCFSTIWVFWPVVIGTQVYIRNSIGIGFALLAFVDLQKEKYRRALILLIIGTLFHYSLAICIAYFIFYQLLRHGSLTRNKMKLLLVFILEIALTDVIIRLFSRTRYVFFANSNHSDIYGSLLPVVVFIIAMLMENEIDKNVNDYKVSYMATAFRAITVPIAYRLNIYRMQFLFPTLIARTITNIETVLANHLANNISRYVLRLTISALLLAYCLFKMNGMIDSAGLYYSISFAGI